MASKYVSRCQNMLSQCSNRHTLKLKASEKRKKNAPSNNRSIILTINPFRFVKWISLIRDSHPYQGFRSLFWCCAVTINASNWVSKWLWHDIILNTIQLIIEILYQRTSFKSRVVIRWWFQPLFFTYHISARACVSIGTSQSYRCVWGCFGIITCNFQK